jgi:uncharacterized membrane protein YedE/YeeE
MASFTPYSALIGGALIGLSAALLLFLNGRIAGISGIVGKALFPEQSEDFKWRVYFLAGLLLGPLVLNFIKGIPFIFHLETSMSVLVVAGLLVGYGTSLGGGCTSGHGICGLARLSLRSIIATVIFMVVAGITVYIVRHLIGVKG